MIFSFRAFEKVKLHRPYFPCRKGAKVERPHGSVLKFFYAGAIAGAFVLGLPMALAIIWICS
jgi:hypothetical protein